MIAMTPCKSSYVMAYGYDPATRTLALEFKGGVFHYDAVPPETFEALKSCASVGEFLNTEVRGKFQHRRITAEGLGQMDVKSRN